MKKKHQQLGINPGTASGRLVKDLLFQFVISSGHVCFRCGLPMSRADFSIEHVDPWLDSNDPAGKFFDLSNIAYSHKSCNSSSRRTPEKIYFTEEEKRQAQLRYQRESNARNYTTERRRAQYARTGK